METNTISDSPLGARGQSDSPLGVRSFNLQSDPWCIIEEDFHENEQLKSEIIFGLANGYICQRANFEEYYSGETILGTYVSGIYYPENCDWEKWKNSYSDIEDKTINAPNWTSIEVRLNEERLDLAVWEVQNFKRILNMREGFLERSFEATSLKGHRIQVTIKRFLSMAKNEVCATSYSIKSLSFEGRISFTPLIVGDSTNNHANNKNEFWNILQTKTQQDVSHLWAQARHLETLVCEALTYVLYKNNEQININPIKIEKEKVAGFSVGSDVRIGDTVCLNKYVAILSSLNHPRQELPKRACDLARAVKQKGWNQLFEEHAATWAKKWLEANISTVEDKEKQQEICYQEFQKLQNKCVN